MKTKILVTIIVLSFISCHSSFAQGSLTPPGAPAASMKSLDQIYAKLDPRIAVGTNTTPGDASDIYIINQSGSYYLTTNVVTGTNFGGNGIEIRANNVTLDLNGFSVLRTTTNDTTTFGAGGIYIPNVQTNVTVRNGNLNGWADGVYSLNAYTAGLVFEKLNVANSAGSGAAGVNIIGSVVIRDCTASGNNYGIAINGNVSPSGSLVTGCTADHNNVGIDCSGGGTIADSTANNNSSFGIFVTFNQFGYSSSDGYLVTKCTANNNAYGIYVQGARNRVEDNHVVKNSIYGITVDVGSGSYTNNIVIKNSAEGSGGANYSITGTQITGPIITTTGTITNLNPWANFSF